MALIVPLLLLALVIAALADIITRDDSQVKHLPKIFWIILVIILPFVGSVLWFAVGRDWGEGGVQMPRRNTAAHTPQAPTAYAPPMDNRTTEQQIADLDREIEEWRLRQEIEKRKQERGEES